MGKSRVYLDDAGSVPILREVTEALRDVSAGNASSPHSEGRSARATLDRARDVSASALGAARTEITFVSSGTEAINLALFGAGGPLVTWAAEHQSVLGPARHQQLRGREVVIASVDSDGRVDVDAIVRGTALVSIGLANNEVGTIQPVAAAIERAHDVGALVHVDACAGPRWIEIPDGADLVSLSGHKLGAGRGGLLYVRDGVRIDPLLFGGPQEWGRRAGHEDVAAAVAISTALSTAVTQRAARSEAARRHSERLRSVLTDIGATLTGAEERLPNFASAVLPGRKGEDMLMALDLEGIAASSGSACASGSLDPSHVLLAMGFSLEDSLGSLRLSTGYATTDDELERAAEILMRVLSRSRAHA